MITDTRFPPQPYQTDGFKLDKGLNLVDPKMFIEPGSLKNCLNYEVVDRIGYKRIDGFSSFDGNTLPSQETFWTITDSSYSGGAGQASLDYPAGSLLEIEGNDGEIFGVVVHITYVESFSTAAIVYARVNQDYEPTTGDTISVYGSTGTFSCDAAPVEYTSITNYGSPSVSNGDSLQYLYSIFNSVLSDEVGPLPNPAIGLHWFHDKLYALCDEEVAWFTSGSNEILIGDLIQDTAGDNTFKVVDVALDAGTWAGGDAAGAIMLEVLTGSIPTSGAIKVTRPTSTTITDAATWSASSGTGITTLLPWKAGLWKSRSVEQAIADGDSASDAGWDKIDTGVMVGFENGDFQSGDFPILDRKTGTVNTDYGSGNTGDGVFTLNYNNFTFSGDTSQTTNCLFSTDASGGTAVKFANAVAAEDSTELWLIGRPSASGGTVVSPRIGLTACNSLQGIPEYATITGVEVFLDNVDSLTESVDAGKYSTVNLEVSLFKRGTPYEKLGDSKVVVITNQNGVGGGVSDETLGSSTDLWGLSDLPIGTVSDADFGVSLKFTDTYTTDAGTAGLVEYIPTIDRIRIKVHYELNFTRYYFWDGTDDVQADLISYYVTTGDVQTGNAEGFMQFANIVETTGAVRRSIQIGDEIHVAAGGASDTKVGDVTSLEVNAPAPKNLIDGQESKYSIITANFYANDDYDGIYGVTGASRAFEFDGTYYLTIFTQEDATKDIPRHIAFHHYHLALGYQGGQIVFSVAGEPSNFDGVLGAVEMAVGDRITGLLPLKGATLGVFCENSIWGINGTVTDQFTTQTISPKLGAIEYTVVDMGEVVFCTSNGISTLSQTDKYGDFLGERLSYNVTPWLQPRLRRRNSSTTIAKDIVCAIPFRTKNQYRLFFKDGYVLIMTLNPDGTSEFTYAQYYKYDSTDEGEEWDDPDYYEARFIVPLAWSSQVDDNGEERIHISHFSEDSEIDGDGNGDYVFELEKGWGFDGEFFPSFIETNWHYQQGPFQNNTLRKVRLEGLTRGSAPLRVYTSKDYETTYSTTYTPISLPNTDLSSFLEDYIAETDMANVAARGRNVGIKITMVPEQYPLPPHVLQALLIQFATGKPDL